MARKITNEEVAQYEARSELVKALQSTLLDYYTKTGLVVTGLNVRLIAHTDHTKSGPDGGPLVDELLVVDLRTEC